MRMYVGISPRPEQIKLLFFAKASPGECYGERGGDGACRVPLALDANEHEDYMKSFDRVRRSPVT